MDCTVYQSHDRLVLVPDCMRASVLVETLFGRLTACGVIDTDSLDAPLCKQFDAALDTELFATSSPDLLLRTGYRPTGSLPPPEGFRWRDGDWWVDEDAALVFEHAHDCVVADVQRGPKGGWKARTNNHRSWEFRGEVVCLSRAAAMQYLVMWAQQHVSILLRDTAAHTDYPVRAGSNAASVDNSKAGS
jgi:hypothetical protein